MRKLTLIVGSLMAACIIGCTVEVDGDIDDKHSYEGGGITFQIPMETSTAQTSPVGIDYEGPRFKAKAENGTLTVDGKDYGKLANGDIVDFYEYPAIKVNGSVRNPDGA